MTRIDKKILVDCELCCREAIPRSKGDKVNVYCETNTSGDDKQ